VPSLLRVEGRLVATPLAARRRRHHVALARQRAADDPAVQRRRARRRADPCARLASAGADRTHAARRRFSRRRARLSWPASGRIGDRTRLGACRQHRRAGRAAGTRLSSRRYTRPRSGDRHRTTTKGRAAVWPAVPVALIRLAEREQGLGGRPATRWVCGRSPILRGDGRALRQPPARRRHADSVRQPAGCRRHRAGRDRGYERLEFSHLAVGQLVANGSADAASPSARRRTPSAWISFPLRGNVTNLPCRPPRSDEPRIGCWSKPCVIRRFRAEVEALGGYDTANAGQGADRDACSRGGAMTVELFGMSRALAGRPTIDLPIDGAIDYAGFLRALGRGGTWPWFRK